MSTAAHTSFDKARTLDALANGPTFVRELLSEIPQEMLKVQRIPGKWTIHEHAVHMTMVDDIMIARLQMFRDSGQPEIVPYFPDKLEKENSLLDLDLQERLTYFDEARGRFVEALKSLPAEVETRRAKHPEYLEYTPRIMMRHVMMHDFLHCYRIEQLWLTRDEYLN